MTFFIKTKELLNEMMSQTVPGVSLVSALLKNIMLQ
jgi:hypothetical protein